MKTLTMVLVLISSACATTREVTFKDAEFGRELRSEVVNDCKDPLCLGKKVYFEHGWKVFRHNGDVAGMAIIGEIK